MLGKAQAMPKIFFGIAQCPRFFWHCPMPEYFLGIAQCPNIFLVLPYANPKSLQADYRPAHRYLLNISG
jgi:hypothetical protein